MILVSGTKRSGTSMWMQVFAAGGFHVLGKQFPRNWEQRALKEANPDGFYESVLRQGIYYETNPHPVTGHYFTAQEVSGYAVKVFVPGVVRTERAYIECVVANIRRWQEYVASIERLYALEDEERRGIDPTAEDPYRFPPVYEWWMENFALVRDASLRKYRLLLHSYDEVLADPGTVIDRVFTSIGGGDVEAAMAAVKPERRTQAGGSRDDVEPEIARIFDELYEVVANHQPVSRAFLETLNETNRRLLPALRQEEQRLLAWRAKQPRMVPEAVEGLP